jgi:hypothetical protein
MQKLIQLLILILVSFLLSSAKLFSQGTVETRSFSSPILGVTKNYTVYLPQDYYQSTEAYPVVYFFRNHENEWFYTSSLKQVADDLKTSGLIGDMILVGPSTGSNNGNYAGCVNMLRPDLAPAAGIGTGMFEDYILNDLTHHIDSTFRTIPDKEHRGIDGFSLGGFISTAISLHHPEVFSSIGSFDGTLMYEDLDDPGIPGTGPDDGLWMVETLMDPIFDVPRNISYMLEHSVINILESADTSLLNLFKSNRYHISQSYCDGAGNYWRNRNFVEKLREKGIRNSWGNPVIRENSIHTYSNANVHATASLIKHWQTFNNTKISAPALIDFSITELSAKTREVVVFNYGPGTLTVNDVQINSSEFSIDNLPSLPITIQPDIDSLLFNIEFLPSSIQSFVDTAYIYSDDPVTPVAKIILRGKGGSFKAEPGEIYAAATGALYEINLDSLSSSHIGNYGNGISNVQELCIDPLTKELFGFGLSWSTYYDLHIINSQGGDGFWNQYIDCTTSSSTAEMGSDSLLYFANTAGNIYSAEFHYPYWLPPVNQITSTGLAITALAFNPTDGVLWAAVGTNEMYTIDLISGNTTLIGTTGLNKVVDDITFNHEGMLYGLSSSGNQMDTLVTINTSSGMATKLGSLNTNFLTAIAISPEGPDGVIVTRTIVPTGYIISQNYPNPFNPTTKIKYAVPQPSQVQIKVFDVLGNEIETLVNEEKSAGTYEITWDAASLPSGVYFYRLQAGEFIETKKMLLLK